MLDSLTASRLATMRRCPKQHYYSYELGLRRVRKSDALHIGSAFHAGLEARNSWATPAEAIEYALEAYDVLPEWADPYDWAIERETVKQLLNGHFWRYENDDLVIVETEREFHIPLVNPETGKPSRTFRLAGKIDGIGRHDGGRESVVEFKTAGEDIGPNSNYWLRLRCDPQISQYVSAAQTIGHDIHDVIYDATRKPSIRPHRATPMDKRKYKKDGTLYANQRETDETPEEYGERLRENIGERPDWYFQRHEIPILDDELQLFRVELWQQAKAIIDARNGKRWFRNVHRFTCNNCDFAELCLNRVDVSAESIPGGFEILNDVHPELKGTDDDQRTTEDATEQPETATATDAFRLC